MSKAYNMENKRFVQLAFTISKTTFAISELENNLKKKSTNDHWTFSRIIYKANLLLKFYE